MGAFVQTEKEHAMATAYPQLCLKLPGWAHTEFGSPTNGWYSEAEAFVTLDTERAERNVHSFTCSFPC